MTPDDTALLILDLDAARIADRARTAALDAWAPELEELAAILLAGIDLPALVAGAHPAAAGAILTRLEHRIGILVGQATELGALAAIGVIAADVAEVLTLDALVGQTDAMTEPTVTTLTATLDVSAADAATIAGANGATIFAEMANVASAVVRATALATLAALGLDLPNTPGARLGITHRLTGGAVVDGAGGATDGTKAVRIVVTAELRLAPDAGVDPDLVAQATTAIAADAITALLAALEDELELTSEHAALVDLDLAGVGTAGDEVIGA